MLSRKYTSLMVLFSCSLLVACSQTPPVNEVEPPITEPEVVEPVVEPEVPVVQPEEEVQPKPTPKPKPLPTTTSDGKLIFGQQEWLYFPAYQTSVVAIANLENKWAQIGAVDLVHFERNGEKWVKFKPTLSGKVYSQISLPVKSWIKSNTTAEDATKVPVVNLLVEIGTFKGNVAFVLLENQAAEQPLILGEQFLRDIAVIDKSRQFIQPKIK
jgi:hypothetical protein